MKGLDLKNVKKIASDEHSTTLQHPSGHKIMIVHALLKPEHKKSLDSMPMCEGGMMSAGGPVGHNPVPVTAGYKDGGEVADKEEHVGGFRAPSEEGEEDAHKMHKETAERLTKEGYSSGGQVSPPKMASGHSVAKGGPDYPSAVGSPAPQASSHVEKLIEMYHAERGVPRAHYADGTADAPVQADDALPPQGTDDPGQLATTGATGNPYVNAAMKGPQQQLEAAQQESQATGNLLQSQGQQATALGQAAGAQNQRLNQMQHDYQQSHDHYLQEVDSMVQDTKNNFIKPNDYLENMGAGQKTATALGLLIGGMGAGLLHQANPVEQFLNAQIDRNIAAQVKNQGTRGNLIDALTSQGHSVDQAQQILRGYQNQMLANQATQIAGKFANPQAQAAAQAFSAKKMGENANAAQQFGTLSLMKGQQAPGQQGQASNEIPDAVDPGLSQSYRVNGVKHYAKDPSTAKDLQSQSDALDAWEQHLKNVKQFNDTQGSVLNPISQAAGTADSLNNTGNILLTKTMMNGSSGLSRLASKLTPATPQAGAINQPKAEGALKNSGKVLLQERQRLIKEGLHGGAPILNPSKKSAGATKALPQEESEE